MCPPSFAVLNVTIFLPALCLLGPFAVSAVSHAETGETREGCLHMIDLAGSERVQKSGAQGTTLVEAKSINKSLSTLGKVIADIASNSRHVAFRDSKLTRLLQPSLSGGARCKTIMLCTLCPLEEHSQESLCTLRFAQSIAACTLRGGLLGHK